MTLARENKILEVLDQDFFPNFQKFLTANESDADSVFSLVSFILKTLADDNKTGSEWKSRVKKLANLFADYEEKKEYDNEQLVARLRWFYTLHDSFTDDFPDIRYETFTSFLSYVRKSKQTNQIIESLTLNFFNEITQNWKLTISQQRDLSLELTLLYTEHEKNQSTHVGETQKHRIQYLKSFESGPKGDNLDDAVNLAVGAIGSALYFCSLSEIHCLLSLRAVNNLSKNQIHAPALQLLTIFAKESADAYEKFYKENSKYITQLGLNHKTLQGHIRTLTLCSLGSTEQTLSYDTLQKAFGAGSVDEVEEIVLDAVVAGRVEAKIDQEKSEVVIYRISPRSFDVSSWQILSTQLDSWKENVSQVLSILQRAQLQQQSTSAPRGGNPKSRGE